VISAHPIENGSTMIVDRVAHGADVLNNHGVSGGICKLRSVVVIKLWVYLHNYMGKD
jgi:hypothetical protein